MHRYVNATIPYHKIIFLVAHILHHFNPCLNQKKISTLSQFTLNTD